MLIAGAKLIDIAARSLFVLIALYALPVHATGQLGLALTLIGFFTFLCGFERYADLQRRMVGTSDVQTDRLIVSTLLFYSVNYALWLPVLLALLVLWVKLPWSLAGLSLVIAIGEHLSNEVYRIALVAPRHRSLLFAVLAKNVATLTIVASLVWSSAATLYIGDVLIAWSVTSFIGLMAVVFGFTRTWAFGTLSAAGAAGLSRTEQYRASRTHFVIGLVALAALQSDRFVVGSLLTLEQSGLYFRHIFLAAFVYQFFNVVSYNRVAARVYVHVRAGRPTAARDVIHRELKIALPIALLLIALLLIIDVSWLPAGPSVQTLRPPYLAVLLFGFMIRAVADYNALLLNGAYRERDILVSQSIALALSIVVNIVLTRSFGVSGSVCVLTFGSLVYLALSGLCARRAVQLKIAT